MTNAITLYDPKQLAEQISNQQLTIRVLSIGNSEIQPVMTDGVHYGKIPGTDKPTLLKPGAELLCKTFGLYADYDPMTQIENFGIDGSQPLFYYRYKCLLRRIEDNAIVGAGIGSCNSHESKYGYRWMPEHEIPAHLDKSKLQRRIDSIEEFGFGIDKAETTGQYGKPAEYWQEFQNAIMNGTAEKFQKKTAKGKVFDAYRITAVTYQVPNPEIASQVNTIDKMAQKRALIAATLNGTAASEFFTQDVEDLPEFNRKPSVIQSDVIEGDFTEVITQPSTPASGSAATGSKVIEPDFAPQDNSWEAQVFAATAFLYDHPNHQTNSINALLQNGKIKDTDKPVVSILQILFHNAGKKYGLSEDECKEIIGAQVEGTVADYMKSPGATVQTAWGVIVASQQNDPSEFPLPPTGTEGATFDIPF